MRVGQHAQRTGLTDVERSGVAEPTHHGRQVSDRLLEVERVGRNAYIMVEGYRNELEQFNLECWALTAESILHTAEWIWLYNHFGYTGDYEFIYFE